jgi:hypothetical protein
VRCSIFTAAEPTLPSLIALTVTDPGMIPTIMPVLFTVAIAGLELCQAIVRLVSVEPSPAVRVAFACSDCPTATDALGTLTATAATGTAATLTVADPRRPLKRAVMIADPFAMARTTPFASTVATAVLDDDQSIG